MLPTVTLNEANYAQRHARTLQALDEGALLVVQAAPERYRNADATYPYRQHSDLLYLTGLAEPGIVLTLQKLADGALRSTLFVPARDLERERWEGPMLGVEGAQALKRFEEVKALEELEGWLKEACAASQEVVLDWSRREEPDAALLWQAAMTSPRRARPTARRLSDARWHLGQARLVKDAAEQARLRQAAKVAAAAHCAQMRAAYGGVNEAELQRIFTDEVQRRGCGALSYEPIVGGAERATFLHYRANNKPIDAASLVLVDAGCECEGYASDITRTWPVGGRFSEAQARVYDVVLAAQLAAIQAVKPGATLPKVHAAALRVLVEGLVDLGVLEGEAEQLEKTLAYRDYFMHGTSHWLGLDVHDPSPYADAQGEAIVLEPGMVLTVEPGLYFGEEAPAAWRGIGVRIEDDVLVTRSGCEVLSEGVPKTRDAIEALCAQVSA